MKSHRLPLVPAAGTAGPAPLTWITPLGLLLKRCLPRCLVDRSFVLLAACALAWIGSPPDGLAQAREQELAANVVRPVHPILIRNQHGPLLRVMIDVGPGQTARLASMEFSLDGTDDLNDIDDRAAVRDGQSRKPFRQQHRSERPPHQPERSRCRSIGHWLRGGMSSGCRAD